MNDQLQNHALIRGLEN